MKNKGFGIGIRDRGDMRRGKAGGGMRDAGLGNPFKSL